MFKSVHKWNVILHESYRGLLKIVHISSAEMVQTIKKMVKVPRMQKCYKAMAGLRVTTLEPLPL
jgi:hypothetical protein